MALTQEEKQSIVSAVLSAISTNARTIDQLTPVTQLTSDDYFEVSGGHRIAYSVLANLIYTLCSEKHILLQQAINEKTLKSISITATETSATLILQSMDKLIECSVPIATSSQSGIVTAADKVKLSDLPTATQLTTSLNGKVDKVSGKGLSSNDYSDTEKQKLEALPTATQLTKSLNDKVDKVTNKGLSSNDYTDTEKQKLETLPTADELRLQHQELQRTGAATPRFSGHIVESDIDYDDERMFMGSAQHTSTDPGCAVVFIRSLGIFALRVLEGATVTLAEMATANGPSGVSPSPGIVDPGMWSPGSDDEPLYQSVKFYLNWADAADMGMHLGETGYEPVPGVMYMCTLSPYGFMRFESADDSAGFPYEAIRVQLMGDSEEVVIRNNRALLSEKAKMKLFVDRWKTRLKEFSANETFELDMANTLEDGSQFGLNGLMLSYDEAQMIDALALPYFAKSGELLYNDTNLTKTLFPVVVRKYYSCQQMFCWNTKLVALSLYPDTIPSIVGQMFAVCRNLEIIYGILNVAYVTNAANATYCFQMCYKLHTVKVKGLKVNFSFVDCPLISLESLLYCVENAINTSAITITVHPNVFAKLTGDTSNAAAAELSQEELTAWGELATLAVSKNISFAS